jgi:hypothetical protein
MEVHHHPHVEKKKFIEYLLEGCMIFLAVSMGFIAENIREYTIEKEHEKQYMKSFYEDMGHDEAALDNMLEMVQQEINASFSLEKLLKKADTKSPANEIYVDFRTIRRQLGIHIFATDRTILQLTNSGGMRLLHNKQITDSLLDYYRDIELIAALQNFSLGQKDKLRDTFSPLIDSEDWDKVIAEGTDEIINPKETLHLRSTNSEVINSCLLFVSDIKGVHTNIKHKVISLKDKAARLKKSIEQSYRID